MHEFRARLNDTPKMVALVLPVAALSGGSSGSLWAYVLIAAGILAGSLAGGRRVTTALAEGITAMSHRDGFAANLVTALLVAPGAALGLPMSTTQVSSGAIIGVGLQKGAEINWRTVRDMILAWVVTLPAAALLGIVVFGILRSTGIN